MYMYDIQSFNVHFSPTISNRDFNLLNIHVSENIGHKISHDPGFCQQSDGIESVVIWSIPFHIMTSNTSHRPYVCIPQTTWLHLPRWPAPWTPYTYSISDSLLDKDNQDCLHLGVSLVTLVTECTTIFSTAAKTTHVKDLLFVSHTRKPQNNATAVLWHKMGVRFFVETAALLSVLDCSINVTILLYKIHVLVTTVDMISFNFISLGK